MIFARALAVLALANGGTLEVPAPPKDIGYVIVHKDDGRLVVNALDGEGESEWTPTSTS